MPKREERSEESRAQPNQRLPKGHFDSDGLSRGEQTGAVRKSPDAEQGPRPEREESR